MFYSIDPSLRRMKFELADDGFLKGDRISVALRGDFQPTPSGSAAVDNFRNTIFRLANEEFDASYDNAVVKAKATVLVAVNDDRPLIDNTDPDGDYGVSVQLVAFTSGDDFFRFGSRTELPSVVGSIYKAGAGNDIVLMPNAEIAGFDDSRMFQTGAGNDEVRAGNLDMRVNLGAGVDTLKFNGANIDWSILENRDNDGVLVVTDSNTRYEVRGADILRNGADTDPLAKFYFKVVRDDDGDCTINFYEDGARVARATGSYDADIDLDSGRYEAFFRRDGKFGERIELIDVDGADHVTIREGGGANPRADFVTTDDFIDAVFDQVRDAYAEAGSTSLPWQAARFTPEVPVTVELANTPMLIDDLLA